MKKSKRICTTCLMLRFMLVFLACVGVFLLNGIYQFWG